MGSYKSDLDFIIIGAQKAGTTSFFRYLQSHPQIYMVPEKEAPYFNHDERFSKGWEWYTHEFFSKAPVDKLWGKASPDYMADPRVPSRIKDTLPNVRLIALLRDPIERAYSHYRMSFRKGIDARSFEDAICDLLEPDVLQEARARPTPTNSYVARGEYGRILEAYYELFPRDQLAIFFTEELANNSKEVMGTVFEFLEVDPGFTPPNLGIRYHRGGNRRRLPWIDLLRQTNFVRSSWRMIPGKYRRSFSYWFHQWNVVPGEENVDEKVKPSVQQLLTEHYEYDVKRLSFLIDKEVPWPEYETDRAAPLGLNMN